MFKIYNYKNDLNVGKNGPTQRVTIGNFEVFSARPIFKRLIKIK